MVLLADEGFMVLLQLVDYSVVAFDDLLLVVGQAFVGLCLVGLESFGSLFLGRLERFLCLGFLRLQLLVEECCLGGMALVGGGQLCLEGLFSVVSAFLPRPAMSMPARMPADNAAKAMMMVVISGLITLNS